MKKPPHHLFLAFLLFSSFPGHLVQALSVADVGVVLNLGTPEGKKSWTSISMAIEDFYIAKPNHSTKVVLHARDSDQDIIGAASAALDLLQNTHVHGIIGASTSAQTEFLIDIGNKTQVPIISFTATSPSLSTTRTPYFIRTTTKDSSQVAAIAAIVKYFGWRQVVPIYEDIDYGCGIIPYLIDAFQEIDVRIPYRSAIPVSATDDQITAELYKLMTMQTRVFVVHMTLASQLITKAGEIGMMSQDYVWIITDSMANTLGSLDDSSIEAMQGVIGVRPYIAKSKVLSDFTLRWKARFRRENPGTDPVEPSIFQFRAYDTTMALAMAVENDRLVSAISTNGNNFTDLALLEVSPSGPKLLEAIKNTRFHGVAGEFQLVDGQLQSSAFEVVNVIGKTVRVIGFWTQANGLSRQLNSTATVPMTVSLKPIIWPGESIVVPKGWQVPTNEKKLRIGVPMKNGFNEFVNVEWDSTTNLPTVTGFCIDVFEAVIKMMPYSVPYEYVPLDGVSPGSYDNLVYKVFLGVFPRGSPLVPDISRAVLNVTEGDTMTEIERKWFGDPLNCPTQSDSFSSTRLDFRNFGGLFLITGAVSLAALFIFIADFLYTERKELEAAGDAAGGSFKNRLAAWAKYFDSKHMKSNTSTKAKEKDRIAGNVNVNAPVAPLHGDGSQSPISNYSDVNLGPPHEGMHTVPGTPGLESPEVAPSIEMRVEY